MLHRLFHTILEIGGGSDFEAYLMGLQSSGRAGIPTVEEARKEYAALMRFGSIS